jgi:hypothetical protein
MSMSQNPLFETALSLPLPERAELATLLSQSLNATGEKFDLASVVDDVHKITQELFPGKCEFTHEFDLEYPDDRYVVVNVEASGTPKELVDRSCQWSERIRQVVPNALGNLRLMIMPV